MRPKSLPFLSIFFIMLTHGPENLSLFAQSICSHYSCFENMGRFATLKKIRSKIWGSKSRVQKQGHCYSKKEEARLPLLFLNNNDPVFCTQLFSGPYFRPDIFQGHKPTHVFKTRIVGAD